MAQKKSSAHLINSLVGNLLTGEKGGYEPRPIKEMAKSLFFF